MPQNSLLLVLALYSLQLNVGADLVCYTEVPNCKSGATLRFRQDIGTAAKQCCVGNSGMSYRITNNEGCTNCVVYAFFSSMADSKLLNNASIGEGDLTGLTVYFGLFKGSPPSIRKVQFKTDALNQGKVQDSSKYTVSAPMPYLTPHAVKFPVVMSASSNNLALEDKTVRVNPQLSSTGENEFVIPLNVAIVDTNVMTVNFSSGAYYASKQGSNVTITIVRGSVAPAKPLKFSLNFLPLNETDQVTEASLVSTTILFPTSKAAIDVPIDAARYNFASAGFAIRLELDDKSQAYSVDLKGRNLTYVYFNKSIIAGFTVSEMNVTAGNSTEICVHVTHPLPGMGPITMTISSANKSCTVTLSESSPVSCIRDTPRAAGLVVYSLSSKDIRQPLHIFPDTLTVTVNEENEDDD